MSVFITEALLEMYFHHAQVKYFEKVFGGRFFRLLKPSPQREAWVGFDQGWARISVSEEAFYASLREAIRSNANSVGHFYFGYFLQFKIVQRVKRRNDQIPLDYPVPYLRSELSLTPNKVTGLSQHGGPGSPISCGLARPRSLVGEKPTQVAVSHGPGIQPCRCSGNRMLDA